MFDKNKDDYSICTRCHFIGHGKKTLGGSAVVEKILWYVLLIPGPLYTLWRRFSGSTYCPKCQSKELVSLDSPMGQKLFESQLKKF